MIRGRAVIVHGLAQARSALAPGLPVVLLSAPGAALYAGAGWWRALVDAATPPGAAPPPDILDCGDAPGVALAALHAGQAALVLDPACTAFALVAARAAAAGAVLLAEPPPALDLGHPREAARLKAWLRGAG